jgi:hypothetical protein
VSDNGRYVLVPPHHFLMVRSALVWRPRFNHLTYQNINSHRSPICSRCWEQRGVFFQKIHVGHVLSQRPVGVIELFEFSLCSPQSLDFIIFPTFKGLTFLVGWLGGRLFL